MIKHEMTTHNPDATNDRWDVEKAGNDRFATTKDARAKHVAAE